MLGYLTYCIMEMVGGIIAIFFVKSMGFTIIRLCYFVFNSLCARYALQLCQYFTNFDDEDREFLEKHPTLAGVNSISIC